jgi:ATP-dependent helicase/nuclease subunit A
MTIIADAAVRERIRVDLETNLLVEAGAGSGKTTALVSRIRQHVLCGTAVEQIVAITFTRKAADELRERLQAALEEATHDTTIDDVARAACAQASQQIDRLYVGTIHGFCARLLREYPVDAGLDPRFTELDEIDTAAMHQRFWRSWIAHERRTGSATIDALTAIGVDPSALADAFAHFINYSDVAFPADATPLPDSSACRRELQRLLTEANALIAVRPAGLPTDKLLRQIQRLQFAAQTSDWTDTATFCAAIESLSASALELTQKHWSETASGKADAKAFAGAMQQWFDTLAQPLLQAWREYRYPIVLRVVREAVQAYAQARQREGTVTFDDLLVLAARLLRERPTVRDECGERFRYLLIDEFQDTDPVQAELCLLLASPSREGSVWDVVVPRPGALFVVGDPKQSIYRFRRADIQVYERVKQRFHAFGSVLALTSNFRSAPVLADFVNAHFSRVFAATASAAQAAFSPMHAARAPSSDAPVGLFTHSFSHAGTKDDVVLADAVVIASWIAARCDAGESPGEFLVLTERKSPLGEYARALAERGVPVTTTGAERVFEVELRELLVLARALADPDSPIAVVAALEGVTCGHTPADLFAARQRGACFTLIEPPADALGDVGASLAMLHAWWLRAQCDAADVLLEQLALASGLLAYGAAAPRGDSRAGEMQRVIARIRAQAADGANTLADAIAVMDAMLGADSDEQSIRAGTRHAVRVMNLHKAKGLEAGIVVLAAPVDATSPAPTVHVTRAASGVSTGGIVLSVLRAGTGRTIIAQPPGWAAMEAAEREFAAAERDRLRYVAATRAKRALVVSQATRQQKTPKPDASLWRAFAEALTAHDAEPLAVVARAPLARSPAPLSVVPLQSAIDAAALRVHAASRSSVTLATVTGALDDETPQRRRRGDTGRGTAWGSAVHRVIESLVRGRSGAAARAFAAAVASDERLGDSDARALLALADRLDRDARVSALRAASVAWPELHVMEVRHSDDGITLLHGVADVATLDAGTWRVIDWKSDDVSDDEWQARLRGYVAQATTYATALARLSASAATAEIERVTTADSGRW